MRILAIETSCDETSLALLEKTREGFDVINHIILSQAQKHAKYGGVFPTLAKREHSKSLIPLFKQIAKNPKINSKKITISESTKNKLEQLLKREPELLNDIFNFFNTSHTPEIDVIAITAGPGLAPALWVGINFAKALSLILSIPLIPINHMEGHLISALLKHDTSSKKFKFINPTNPTVALLVSGGHTQLIAMNEIGKYRLLGETLDDAVGEAFDKVARMLGLSYPGGPTISALASQARKENLKPKFKFPRPMIKDHSLNFSFSGLKTAVLYHIRTQEKISPLNDNQKKLVAREFEDAVADVLTEKLKKAVSKFNASAIIIAGGVSANTFLHKQIQKNIDKNIISYLPYSGLTGDNALMIGAVAIWYLHNYSISEISINPSMLQASANWRIDDKYNNSL